ncbi:MAG: hypothetical protein CNLJKLNK_00041 [Holosporales bacterium]
MLKFVLALFFTSVWASDDDVIYHQHMHESYKNPTCFREESEKCIQFALNEIEQGSSIKNIMDALALKRREIEKGVAKFGAVRKKMLLTQGNNYFIMREEVEKILKRLFESDALLSSAELKSKAAQIKDPIFSVSVRDAYPVFQRMQEIMLISPELKAVDANLGIEGECSRFLIKLGLLTKEEMRTRLMTVKRYQKVEESYLYASCMSLKALFVIKKEDSINVSDRSILENFSDVLKQEEKNKGIFITLTRSFLDIDIAQKIHVLVHPNAESWAECAFMLVHTHHKYIPYFDTIIKSAFDAYKREIDPLKMRIQLHTIEYAISAQTPYFRGSAAINEWMTTALARYKGIHLEHKGYCQTDQLAQVLPYFAFLKRRLENPRIFFKKV